MNHFDLYYKILSVTDTICDNLIDAYCCAILTKPFLDRREKAWLTGGVYAAIMFIFDFMPWYINPMSAYILGAIAIFFAMCLMDREYFSQKFFLAVTFFCLRWQAPRIIIYINNEIDKIVNPLLVSASLGERFWFLWSLLTTFIEYNLFCFLLLYGAVKCILFTYGRGREYMGVKELLLLSLPSVSGAFSYGVIRYYSYIYERDTGESVYALYGSHDLIMLLFTILSFAVILVTTYVFRQWKTEQEEDRQRQIFSTQMADLQNHIGEVERLYRDLRSFRHDVGNHLMTLEQLYSGGEFEAAEQYSKTMKKSIQNFSKEISSGNPVTDVILSGRKKEMEEKGIDFSCRFHYPVESQVNSFDISIILNNALSNAIEAIERERSGLKGEDHISLVSNRRKNMYIIEVTNSYKGIIKTDTVSGLPKTLKTDEGHGFGLASIRHVARKYLGDIEICKEIYEGEERCVLRVMLQMEKSFYN